MKLQDKAILVKLSISLPGNTRTDKQITSETISHYQMGVKAGRWLKQIFPDEAMTPLVKLQGEIRTWVYANTLPWTDEGYRILPTAHHAEFTDALREFKGRFNTAASDFVRRLPDWEAWAREAHNGTFDASYYNNPAKINAKFGISLDFSPVPSGSDFRADLNAEDLANMAQQVEERIQFATEQARADLWARLAEPLKAIADRLSEPDRKDGKSPIFRDSLIGNLADIAKLVPALNVTADAQLGQFATEVQTLLKGQTESEISSQCESLRASKAEREATAKRAAEILSRMSGYMPEPITQ